jgi:hypothetical protein
MVGVRSIFRHGEGLWHFIPFEEFNPRNLTADALIVGGWSPVYRHLLQYSLLGKKIVWIASSLGEMWLEPVELDFLKQILSLKEIQYIAFGDYEAAEVFKVNPKAVYLPYPIHIERFKQYNVEEKHDIVLFSPYTLKKNALNELAAVALIQRDQPIMLHLNNPETAKLADFLGVKYQYHGWLPDEEYYQFLASMRVSLQCSIAESFGYFGIESALLGVVPVTSPTIKWNLPELTVQNINSPSAIADKIKVALNFDPTPLKEKIITLARENNILLSTGLEVLLRK